MTAPDVAALVDEFTPLALAVADGYGRPYPWLLDDFRSDAAFALFRVLSSPAAETATNLGAMVRVAVRNAMMDRIEAERRRHPASFRPQPQLRGANGELLDPLALLAGDEPEPGAATEAAEEVAALVERAGLTERQRAVVERVVGNGEELGALAAELDVCRSRVGQIGAAALAKLRAAAGTA